MLEVVLQLLSLIAALIAIGRFVIDLIKIKRNVYKQSLFLKKKIMLQ
jgi:hypothetical protein